MKPEAIVLFASPFVNVCPGGLTGMRHLSAKCSQTPMKGSKEVIQEKRGNMRKIYLDNIRWCTIIFVVFYAVFEKFINEDHCSAFEFIIPSIAVSGASSSLAM